MGDISFVRCLGKGVSTQLYYSEVGVEGGGGQRQTKGANLNPKNIFMFIYIYKFIYIYEVCIHKRKNTKNKIRTSSRFAFLSSQNMSFLKTGTLK